MDLARFLERPDKHTRIQESILRVDPTGKRLHAAERFRNRTHHGLVVNLDIAVRNRLVDMVHHVVLQDEVFVQFLVVIADKVVALFFWMLQASFAFSLASRNTPYSSILQMPT